VLPRQRAGLPSRWCAGSATGAIERYGSSKTVSSRMPRCTRPPPCRRRVSAVPASSTSRVAVRRSGAAASSSAGKLLHGAAPCVLVGASSSASWSGCSKRAATRGPGLPVVRCRPPAGRHRRSISRWPSLRPATTLPPAPRRGAARRGRGGRGEASKPLKHLEGPGCGTEERSGVGLRAVERAPRRVGSVWRSSGVTQADHQALVTLGTREAGRAP